MSIKILSVEKWGGSYEEIHAVLFRAHQQNRAKGIVYKSAFLTGEEIKSHVGKGVTFVAIDDSKVVGTASVSMRIGKYWYDKGLVVAHYCLDAVLPEYQGQGIMKSIDKQRDLFAIQEGAKLIRSGTAQYNSIQRKKFEKQGFVPVDFLVTKGNGYYSVMYAKWIDISIKPTNNACRRQYLKSIFRTWLFYKKNGRTTLIGKVLKKLKL